MTEHIEESNILVCGSSRVGKSTLINAICRRELSKSNASLCSRTKSIDRYSSSSVIGHITYETNFWDSPGIESWNEYDVRSYVVSLIEQTHPLCMIYCASPGSFAILDHVAWIISECHKKNIFCALVCTNMWAGRNRQCVVDEFYKLLNTLYPEIKPIKEDGIIYFDRVALVTMVNSKEHVDEDFGVVKAPSGINELIFGIAKCLKRDFMIAWFRAVSENKSFWTTMSSKLSNLLKIPYEKFNTLYEHAEIFLDSLLIDYTDYDDDNIIFNRSSSMHYQDDDDNLSEQSNTSDNLFHDAVILEMPNTQKSKELLFRFKSNDIIIQFNGALAQLGACRIKNLAYNQTDNLPYPVLVEFEDEKKLQAIYTLCQVMNSPYMMCIKIDDMHPNSSDDVS